jgi:hypothetical protein
MDDFSCFRNFELSEYRRNFLNPTSTEISIISKTEFFLEKGVPLEYFSVEGSYKLPYVTGIDTSTSLEKEPINLSVYLLIHSLFIQNQDY